MKYGLALGCALCILASLAAANAEAAQADFFQFWAAGHIAAAGGNPYDLATWSAIHAVYQAKVMDNQFIYPLPAAILLSPLGLLPPHTAYLVWIQLSAGMIALAAIILRPRGARRWIAPLLACIFVFRPAITNLLMGHLGGALLLAVAVALYCWRSGPEWGGGLALSLLAIKPGLGLPILALVCVWLVRRRHWGALAAICAGCSALLWVGLIYDRQWPLELASIILAKPSCGQISLGWLGALLAAVAVGMFLFANIKAPQVISLAIAAGLAAAPYVWTYDYILLLGPILVLVESWPIRSAILALVAVDLLAAGLALASALMQSELANAALPVAVGLTAGIIFVIIDEGGVT